MAASPEPQSDPGDPQAAIDRYREIAKYLITIFAGVGGLLVAGSQLSSLGKLSFDDNLDRLATALGGLLAGILAIAWLVWAAIKILRPVEMSLDELLADADLTAQVNARPSLLGDASSVAQLKNVVESDDLLEPDERESWSEVVKGVLGFAAYQRAQERFQGALPHMFGGALVATIAIAAFAWGSNPPEDETADPVVRPLPQVVTFRLTADGRDTFGQALGVNCSTERFRGLTIGGDEKSPRVVTLPEKGCNPVQFVLAPEFGAPVSTKKAPGG